MLTLFGAGGPMLIAIAALGALAMAFQYAAKKAEELEEENRRVRDFTIAQNKMIAGVGPGYQMLPAEQLAQLQVLRGRAVLYQEGLRGAAGGPLMDLLISHGDANAIAAKARIDMLTQAVKGFDQAIQNLRRQLNAPADFKFGTKDLGLAFGKRFDDTGPKGFQEIEVRKADWFMERIKTTTGKEFLERRAQRFELTPQTASMLLFSLMALQQGGTRGAGMALGGTATALAGMTGIAGHAAAGPLGWIGFGLSALASIFGSKMDEAKRQRDQHHAELMGALHEGPARISQYFEGDPEASLYQNRRLERLGGEPRNGGL